MAMLAVIGASCAACFRQLGSCIEGAYSGVYGGDTCELLAPVPLLRSHRLAEIRNLRVMAMLAVIGASCAACFRQLGSCIEVAYSGVFAYTSLFRSDAVPV